VPTPRKLKRSTAKPDEGNERKSSLVTSEVMFPPCCGWGWQRTTVARAPSGTISSASRESPSDVVVRRERVAKSSVTSGDGTVVS
jgi:hypothetical protein